MIMAKGNNQPNIQNSLFLRPAWEKGLVGKFNEECDCFCRGCNYTIMVSSETAQYITFSAKTTGLTVAIPQSTGVVYDSVLYWQKQCYSY